jgi:hypothetical protein
MSGIMRRIGAKKGDLSLLRGEAKMNFLSNLFGKNVNAKVDDLIYRLKDPDSSIRESSTRQMIALGKPAVDPLIIYLKDQDEWARLMAAAALGKIGDIRALGPLEQALKDTDEGVRSMARTALNELQQKCQKKIQAEKVKRVAEWSSKQPRCSRCGRNSDKVAEDAKRAKPGTIVIGNLVGVCPECKQAFCTSHAPYDYGVDGIVCPIHKKELDLYWDGPPSGDRPWRIGSKP